MSKLAILGAGGHGKVVADIALQNNWDSIDFYDDNQVASYPWLIVGGSKDLLANLSDYDGYFVAIGNNLTRKLVTENLLHLSSKLVTLKHPQAIVSPLADIGKGALLGAGCIINAFAVVYDGSIINTGSTVDHDCTIGPYAHIAPGANLAGDVTVAECSWVGIGATVKQLVTIGSNVMIGAGTVVLKDVPPDSIVAGNPARNLYKPL